MVNESFAKEFKDFFTPFINQRLFLIRTSRSKNELTVQDVEVIRDTLRVIFSSKTIAFFIIKKYKTLSEIIPSHYAGKHIILISFFAQAENFLKELNEQ